MLYYFGYLGNLRYFLTSSLPCMNQLTDNCNPPNHSQNYHQHLVSRKISTGASESLLRASSSARASVLSAITTSSSRMNHQQQLLGLIKRNSHLETCYTYTITELVFYKHIYRIKCYVSTRRTSRRRSRLQANHSNGIA